MSTLLSLARGQTLIHCGAMGPAWKIEHGVFLVEAESQGQFELLGLAGPGRILGAEGIQNLPYLCRAIALNDAVVRALPVPDDASRIALLTQAYCQQLEGLSALHRLRSGRPGSRVSLLLDMLGVTSAGSASTVLLDRDQLPSLRDLARILNLAAETVCRELGHWLPARRCGRPRLRPLASQVLALA